MEITFKVKGKNEAELDAAAKKVLTDFNNYDPNDWSYSITAAAVQDDAGKIGGWDGTVKATRSRSQAE